MQNDPEVLYVNLSGGEWEDAVIFLSREDALRSLKKWERCELFKRENNSYVPSYFHIKFRPDRNYSDADVIDAFALESTASIALSFKPVNYFNILLSDSVVCILHNQYT